MNRLRFDNGTLTFLPEKECPLPEALEELFVFDTRTKSWRSQAVNYAPAVLALRKAQIEFADEARNYELLNDLELQTPVTPYEHQTRALGCWRAAGYRGVVSLPTGSGKTILAVLAIAELKRPALILVPTIDLLVQWCRTLQKFFNHPISMLGGGSHEIGSITVSTYDSALLNIDFIGNRFALLVADECHHLPARETRLCATMAIAPFRLGLSATPELDAERMEVLTSLMGEIVCNTAIDELEGKILSNYLVKKIPVGLTAGEQRAYNAHRAVYTAFLRAHRISFSTPGSWNNFLCCCARYPGGKEALNSFMAQRLIARNGSGKMLAIRNILLDHPGERVIIFTADNHTAYNIGRKFVLPVLTHHTKAAERKELLDLFKSGDYSVLVTSKVLNEGIDVPEVSAGIVVSGSGSVREHVQRLGRILRPAPGKKCAILYELVSSNTSEEYTSSRRREHRAYRKRSR